jgi:hypothetical protein
VVYLVVVVGGVGEQSDNFLIRGFLLTTVRRRPSNESYPYGNTHHQ